MTLQILVQNINQTLKTQGFLRSTFGVLLTVTPLVVLAMLIWQEREQLLSIHWNFDPTILLFSFVLYSFALGIAVINWGILMNELGGRLSWPLHFKAYCQTNAARRVPILPWHIIGRVYIYQLHGIGRLISSAASALELLIMLIAGLIISLLILPVFVPINSLLLLTLIGFVAICVWLIQPRQIRRFLLRLGGNTDQIHLSIKTLGSSVLRYLAIWCLGGLILFSLSTTLDNRQPGSIWGFIMAWSVSGVAALILSFTPLSLGFRELSLAVMLIPVLPLPIAVLLSIVARVLFTIYEILWAVIASLAVKE